MDKMPFCPSELSKRVFWRDILQKCCMMCQWYIYCLCCCRIVNSWKANSEEVGIVCLCGHISDRMNLNMWQGRMSALAILCLSLVLLPGICSLLCCKLPGGSLGSAADPQEKTMLTIYYIGLLIAKPSIHLWSTKTFMSLHKFRFLYSTKTHFLMAQNKVLLCLPQTLIWVYHVSKYF